MLYNNLLKSSRDVTERGLMKSVGISDVASSMQIDCCGW